jgi:GNAT superfamily N-acetyltransferase
MTVTIRPVDPSEYDQVAELVVAAYGALRPLRPVYEAEIRDVARRASRADVLVATDDTGELLGTVTFVGDQRSVAREISAPDEAEFRMLGVSPHAQGRGVGTLLVEDCVRRARALGRRRLVLSTGDWMTSAHRLYERAGFRRTPDRDWKPAPEVHLMAYALEL